MAGVARGRGAGKGAKNPKNPPKKRVPENPVPKNPVPKEPVPKEQPPKQGSKNPPPKREEPKEQPPKAVGGGSGKGPGKTPPKSGGRIPTPGKGPAGERGPDAGPGTGTPDLEVAKIVYMTGRSLRARDKVMLAAFEAALVESGMENLNHGDRDSLGVFQQRPSQGWGTPEQVTNVAYASRQFFTRAIANDKKNPSYTAGQLAQSVQISAYPDRYDEREDQARKLIERTVKVLRKPSKPQVPEKPGGGLPRGPKLDVAYPDSYHDSRDHLYDDLATFIHAHYWYGPLDPSRPSVGACYEKIMALDEWITDASRKYRMRKALIQSVVYWEYRSITPDERLVDQAVEAYYTYKVWQSRDLGLPAPEGWNLPVPDVWDLPVPEVKDDSSTGVAQIFARTAIDAHNHAVETSRLDATPLDKDKWGDIWSTWKQLHEDEKYSVGMVALVHLHSAARTGVSEDDPLRWDETARQKVLTRYNGTGDEAEEYGDRAALIYDIFEKHNAPLRD